MSICLSHISADRALEVIAQDDRECEPATATLIESFGFDEVDVLGLCDRFGGPLHILSANKGHNGNNENLVIHTWTSSLADGAIKRIEDGLYVASPEFCLLQQASVLHPVNLCQMLGRYLGTAVPGSLVMKKNDLIERNPLVSRDGLEAFLSGMHNAKGVTALRNALRWTCAGAASPQETNLQLALSLPPTFGGFGLRTPMMNYKVKLKGVATKLYKLYRNIYIDLAWKTRGAGIFGLEYQGSDHGGKFGEDYARYLSAREMNCELIYVASEQLRDADQMDYIARIVAKRTGKRITESNWPSLDDADWLLRVLRGRHIPRINERRREARRSGQKAA